jgi:hypothetical protein
MGSPSSRGPRRPLWRNRRWASPVRLQSGVRADTAGHGKWNELILHTFASVDGFPWGAFLAGRNRNLYGTTQGSPVSNSEVYELSSTSNGWDLTVLYTDGAGPGLRMNGPGNLYGEMGPGQYEHGAIAELSPGSGGWIYTDIYDFCSQYNWGRRLRNHSADTDRNWPIPRTPPQLCK